MGGRTIYDYASKRKVIRDHADCAVCVSCGKRQYVAKWAWERATRLTCASCGGFLEPSKKAQKETPEKRTVFQPEVKQRCKNCQAYLRSGNSSGYCAACEKTIPFQPSEDDFKKSAREPRKPATALPPAIESAPEAVPEYVIKPAMPDAKITARCKKKYERHGKLQAAWQLVHECEMTLDTAKRYILELAARDNWKRKV